jgi:hypothetical protein
MRDTFLKMLAGFVHCCAPGLIVYREQLFERSFKFLPRDAEHLARERFLSETVARG